jgi:IS30 family transposase
MIRRRESRKRERVGDEKVREYLTEKLEIGWSPEQIAGRIGRDLPGKTVSHETIYQYIFKQDRELTQYLVCGRKNRRKRIQKRGKRVMIANRQGIENRPDAANSRTERGHWEGDTAISRRSKTALLILHERKHGITLLQKIPRCAPTEMKTAVCIRLGTLPPKWRKTLTLDNGQENRAHEDIQKELKLDTYFCNPYSSWEKGSVENTVGLTRRFWPKKTDYALISDEEIATLEYRLNTRPRKRLGYLTPYEHAKSVAFTP